MTECPPNHVPQFLAGPVLLIAAARTPARRTRLAPAAPQPFASYSAKASFATSMPLSAAGKPA